MKNLTCGTSLPVIAGSALASLKRTVNAVRCCAIVFVKHNDRWVTFDLLSAVIPQIVVGQGYSTIADEDKETVEDALTALGYECSFVEKVKRGPNAKITV